MAMTFKQLLETLNTLKHTHAVYEHLVCHLEEFIPGEGEDPATDSSIESEAGGVPLPVLQDVLEEIKKKYITPLEAEIGRLEMREIPDEEKEQERESKGGKEGSARKGGVGRKTGGKAGSNSSGSGTGRGKAKKLSLRNG